MSPEHLQSSEPQRPAAGERVASPAPPRKRFPVVLLLVVAVFAYLQWPMLKGTVYRVLGVQPRNSAIAWQRDFESARSLAQTTAKPMLLVFSAAWCPPCNVMKHDVWPDHEVETVVNRDFVPLYLDVDEQSTDAIAERYGVGGIPAVLVVNAEGTVLRKASFMSQGKTLEFLNQGTHEN